MEPREPQLEGWLDGDADAVALAAGARADSLAVAQLTAAEFATVPLTGRVNASVGRMLEVICRDGSRITGHLVEAGNAWMLLRQRGSEVLIAHDAIAQMIGLSRHASAAGSRDAHPARTPGMGLVLRQWNERQARVRCGLVSGQVEGTITRVGRDAVDLTNHPLDRAPTLVDAVVVIPISAINWVVATT